MRLRVPGVDRDDPARVLAFGRQLDVRPVRTSRRTDAGSGTTDHHRRIRSTCRHLASRAAAENNTSYHLLGKWVGMLGFRGHFATKSRRYSITLGALRRARRRARALIAQACIDRRPLALASLEADLLAGDESETTLVVGDWHYLGTGWATEAQRVLAIAAAARARRYDRERTGRNQPAA